MSTQELIGSLIIVVDGVKQDWKYITNRQHDHLMEMLATQSKGYTWQAECANGSKVWCRLGSVSSVVWYPWDKQPAKVVYTEPKRKTVLRQDPRWSGLVAPDDHLVMTERILQREDWWGDNITDSPLRHRLTDQVVWGWMPKEPLEGEQPPCWFAKTACRKSGFRRNELLTDDVPTPTGLRSCKTCYPLVKT